MAKKQDKEDLEKQQAEKAAIEKQIADTLDSKTKALAETEKKNAADIVGLIKIAIDKPPYKTEDPTLKQKYIDLANKYISKLRTDKEIDDVIAGLTTDENSVFLEYVLKNLKSIASGPSTSNATQMLKIQSRIIEKKGYGIILKTINRKNPL